jgi:hypothetical protein
VGNWAGYCILNINLAEMAALGILSAIAGCLISLSVDLSSPRTAMWRRLQGARDDLSEDFLFHLRENVFPRDEFSLRFEVKKEYDWIRLLRALSFSVGTMVLISLLTLIAISRMNFVEQLLLLPIGYTIGYLLEKQLWLLGRTRRFNVRPSAFDIFGVDESSESK